MSNNEESVISSAIRRHSEAVVALERILTDIEKAASLLLEAAVGGKRVLICGNGGSAADAQHFAAEFICKYKEDRRPFEAIALTVDSSILTAVGNDYGFEHIFSRQVDALGKEGCVLVAITTSGSSKNILLAIEAAKKKGMKVVVLTGAKGEKLKSEVDVNIAVPSEETARIQEMHGLIIHAWCEYIDEKIKI